MKSQSKGITDLEIWMLNLDFLYNDYIKSAVYSFLQKICAILAEIGLSLWFACKCTKLDHRHNTFTYGFFRKILQSKPCPNVHSVPPNPVCLIAFSQVSKQI